MSEFNKDDVLKVAEAMVENHTEYNGCRSNYNGRDYECIYCSHEADKRPDIKHALDCPVLVAQDLLT